MHDFYPILDAKLSYAKTPWRSVGLGAQFQIISYPGFSPFHLDAGIQIRIPCCHKIQFYSLNSAFIPGFRSRRYHFGTVPAPEPWLIHKQG